MLHRSIWLFIYNIHHLEEADGSHLVSETVSSNICGRATTASVPLPPHISVDNVITTHDLNDHTKTRGFLNHEIADFTFIGPDRQIHECNDIETYIHMARTIQESGGPNCKFARFILQSGLNIPAWYHHLKACHDKFLNQYFHYFTFFLQRLISI